MKNELQSFNQIVIGYATETGNAYELALQTYLSLRGIADLPQEINEKFIFKDHCCYILFISTTGQGDPPYSMRPFWKGLMNKGYRKLNGVKFCVYGLGDRSYGDNFNLTARKFRQRLLMLEAQEVVEIGLGDQQDSNGCFDQYFRSFFPSLSSYLSRFKIQPKASLKNDPLIPSDFVNNRKMKNSNKELKIISQRMLSSRQEKDVYEILLDLPIQKGQQIKIGDILEVYPHNGDQIVEETYQYFTSNGLNDLKVSSQELKKYLRQVANLENIVNFTFFNTKNKQWAGLDQMLAPELDANIKQLFQAKLKELGEDYDQYYNYVKKFRRNVMEVISDFSLRIPLSCFAQRLGHIISRKYSISKFENDPESQRSRIGLLISLQKYKVSSNRIIKGLCSHDLCLTQLGEEKSYRMGKILRNGQFEINVDFSKAIQITMISLGTGIAPFLSILDQAAKNKSQWQLTLFYSSRYLNEVPIQKEVLEALRKQNQLSLFLTHTREKGELEKRRLQFVIKDNLKEIEKAKQGKIMICGPKQFCEIVCRIFQEELALDVKKLKKGKIICIENW